MIYREPSGFVNFGGSQSGSDLSDRDESHIASIWPRSDRLKMGRYDGLPNSQNLTVRGIYPFHLRYTQALFNLILSDSTG